MDFTSQRPKVLKPMLMSTGLILASVAFAIIFFMLYNKYKDRVENTRVKKHVWLLADGKWALESRGRIMDEKGLKSGIKHFVADAGRDANSSNMSRLALYIHAAPAARMRQFMRLLDFAEKNLVRKIHITEEGSGDWYSVPLPDIQKQWTSVSTIDPGEIRIKLLWARPGTRTEFSKRLYNEPFDKYAARVRNGEVLLKVEKKYFQDSAGKPDFLALAECIRKAKADFRTPSFNPKKIMPVIIDAREMIPMKFFIRTVQTVRGRGIPNNTIARPDFPY
jgi:hypothetical protein